MQQAKKLLIILSFVLITLFLSKQLLFFNKGYLEQIANDAIYPAIWIANKITQPIKNLIEKRKLHKKLAKKYEQLQKENEELLSENIKMKASLKHYQASKELLEFQQRYNLQNAIFAKILVKNLSELEHYMLINRGKNDDIEKDMVALYKFQIIGRVTDVYTNHSKVLLITDSNCKIAAFANKTKASGIVKGANNINQCDFCYVSHLSKIENNDLVISSGQGLIFPEGFSLGRIIKHNKKDLYHDITIKPLVNLRNIEFCLLISLRQGFGPQAKQAKIKAF